MTGRAKRKGKRKDGMKSERFFGIDTNVVSPEMCASLRCSCVVCAVCVGFGALHSS